VTVVMIMVMIMMMMMRVMTVMMMVMVMMKLWRYLPCQAVSSTDRMQIGSIAGDK
jgi:hypothetical protein